MRFSYNKFGVSATNLCRNTRPTKAFFNKRIWSDNIKMSKKIDRKEADRAYYIENRTEILRKQKAYRLKNKTRIAMYQKVKQQEYKQKQNIKEG